MSVDRTPRAVTLPAHVWPTVREACEAHARRLRHRSRTRLTPAGYSDLDALRAESLDEAASAILNLTETLP